VGHVARIGNIRNLNRVLVLQPKDCLRS